MHRENVHVRLERLIERRLDQTERLANVFLDSLDHIDFLMKIEDEFDIVIDQKTAAELETVEQLVEVIYQKATDQ